MKKTNEMIYDNILQKLKASKKPNELEGKMISGEEIAKEEKITRSYVSKVIAKLIEKGYDIKLVQPVDMFPHTSNCETITLLEKQIKKF